MFKCAICNHEYWYRVPRTCHHCSAKLDAAKHDELRHLDFVRSELECEEVAHLLTPEANERLLVHYQSKRDTLVNELRGQVPAAPPPEMPIEPEPAREEPEQRPPEVAPGPEIVPAVPAEPEPIRPDFSKWGEKLIRSLLYLGVFGLICTFLLIIYGPRSEAVPPAVKLGVLVLITVGIYGLGYLLRYKFELSRTGLALIFLSLALVPLLYLAAKRFGVLAPEHTLLEWFRVALFCTILYAIVAVIIDESTLMYLTAFAGATTASLLMGHLGWFDARRFAEIALVFTLLSAFYLGISTYSKRKRRDSMPFLIASQILMVFVLFSLMYYTSLSRFKPASAVCGMITAYYIVAYCMRRVLQLVYIPCVSLVATGILLTLSKTTDSEWIALAITVPASLYLYLGVSPRIPEQVLPKLPLRHTSFGWMLVVLWMLVVPATLFVAMMTSLDDSDYLQTVYIGLMATAYFVPSALVRANPDEMYIPAVTFVVTALSFAAKFLPSRYNVSPSWFCTPLILAAGGYGLTRLRKREYARALYSTSYYFSLVPFAIALCCVAARLAIQASGLALENSRWIHAPSIAGGLAIGAAYYLGCAYFTRKDPHVYLGIGAVSALSALAVDVSALPAGATFMFLALFALALGVSAFKRRGAWWSLSARIASHVLAGVNMLYLGWVVATELAERHPDRAVLYPLVACLATLALYLYEALQRKQQLFAYLSVTTAYMAVAIVLFTGLGASYIQARIVVALISLVAVGLEHRLRMAHDRLWREPLLAVRNVAVGAIVIVCFLHRTFSTAPDEAVSGTPVNVIALYVIAGLTAVATALTRHDEPGQRPATYTFAGGALFFLAVRVLLRDVLAVPSQWVSVYAVCLSVPYLIAGRLLLQVKDKSHSWASYALATLIATYAIAISLPHRSAAIFTCIGASVIYGTLAYLAKKDVFLYASIVSFSLAYLFSLVQSNVPVHAYGLYFLVVGLTLTLIGKAVRPGAKRLEDNPFYVAAALLSVVVVASIFVAGKMYFTTEINTSIAVTVAAALMYALFAFFLGSRRLFLLSGAMLLGTYYLLLLKYEVSITHAYTFPPAAILVGLGVADIRATGPPASSTARRLISAGLLVLFLPAFVKTVAQEDFLEGMLIMVFGVSIIYLSMRLKVKVLFAGAAIAIAGDILVETINLMRTVSIPREVYIGTGSVLLIFMGCLAEKRFKAAVTGTVRRTKDRIANYFEGWA